MEPLSGVREGPFGHVPRRAVTTTDALRDRITELAIIWDRESIEPAEDFANAVLALLADADPTDLGFKRVDGITYCAFHDATVTAERARTGACDRAHHFCAEVPVYVRPRPEETDHG